MGFFSKRKLEPIEPVCIPQKEPIAPHLEKARKLLLNPKYVGDRHAKSDKMYTWYSNPAIDFGIRKTWNGYSLKADFFNTLLRRTEFLQDQEYSSMKDLNDSIADLNEAYEILYGTSARDAWDKGCCECKCN